MARVAAVVFDLDGTLIDSRDDIASAANVALAAVGRSPMTRDAVCRHVGDGARALIERCLGATAGRDEVERALSVFLHHYAAHPAAGTTLMPGAAVVLDGLRLPKAVCTNKPRAITEAVLSALGLTAHFAALVAGDDLEHKKPDPAPLLSIARTLDVAPTALVMVGDGPQDIECGRAAGALTVGVRGGMLPEELLRAARPDALLADLGELPALLRRWAQATSA